MAYVYNKEEKLLFIQCKQCKGIIEIPCEEELHERITSENFRFEDVSDLEDVPRHAIVLGICDCCFRGMNRKKEVKE